MEQPYRDASREALRRAACARAYEARHAQAERCRIRAEIWREAADLTERRRQQREGDREQRRIMREGARTAWAALRRFRRTRHEP